MTTFKICEKFLKNITENKISIESYIYLHKNIKNVNDFLKNRNDKYSKYMLNYIKDNKQINTQNINIRNLFVQNNLDFINYLIDHKYYLYEMIAEAFLWDIKWVKYLINLGENKIDINWNYGIFFSNACKKGDLELVKYLIYLGEKKGCEKIKIFVDPPAPYFTDHFYSACVSGNFKLIKFLINLTNQKNYDDIFCYTYGGFCDFFIKILALKNLEVNFLIYIINLTKKRGFKFNINLTNNYAETPLFIACKCGNVKIVRFLMKNYNKQINLKKNTETYFIWACAGNNTDVIKYLINLRESRMDKINIHVFNEKPIKLLIRNNNLEMVKYFMFLGEKRGYGKINIHDDVNNDNYFTSGLFKDNLSYSKNPEISKILNINL
jgi:ankyrin repeat protein